VSTSVRVVLSTFPTADKAAEVARILVEERLCACVNLVPAVRSIYRWEGAVADDTEVLALIKTTDERIPPLVNRLITLHPYEVPEALVLGTEGGAEKYLSWVVSSTT
jgi:periplasmic divalent cation tolerance protein